MKLHQWLFNVIAASICVFLLVPFLAVVAVIEIGRYAFRE